MRKLAFKIMPYAIIIALALPIISYFVPNEEVLRITSVGTIRVDKQNAKGEDPRTTRDVYEIYAETLHGQSPRIFYNEDAIWYLKFDSGSVQSAAAGIASEKGIAAISGQGWRIPIISMIQNALSVKRVSEDYRPFPLQPFVFGIFIVLLLGLRFVIKRALKQFRERAEARHAAAREVARAKEEARNQKSDSGKSSDFESFLREQETK